MATLEWQTDHPTEKLSMNEAKEYVATLGEGWRLPTVQEYLSTVDYSATNPVCPDTKPDWYWTVVDHAVVKTDAWAVNFYHGSVGSFPKSFKFYVRCCRSLDNKT